jgi:ABC-type multidrug transport system ATPase subunit
MQDDVLLATQTPMEILEFAAKLRLPTTMSDLEKRDRVLQVITQLNLSKCKDTKVGAAGVARGVSGGERKRVSVRF